MGLLSMLGKLGAGIAAPFTGGASLAVIPALDAVGNVLGSGASSAAAGRRGDAETQAYMNAANNRAQMDAASFNRDTEGQLMRRALMARMLGDTKPVSDPRGARFQTRTMSPEFTDMLSRYGGQADRSVGSGDYKVTPMLSTLPKAGLLEKIGGVAGMAGGILGALQEAGRMAQPKKPPQFGGPGPTGPFANVRF